jgi:hypothetical protein
MNLGSVNYLVAGAPKVWYCVPPSDYLAVVKLISKLFAGSTLVKTCPQAVMHKRFLIHPETLRENGITCSRVVQEQGDLIVTFPGAFHFGYNTAYNIAEATNFATHEWYSGGHLQDSWDVGQCTCKSAARFFFEKDMVIKGLKRVALRFGLDPFTLTPLRKNAADGGLVQIKVKEKKKKKKKTMAKMAKIEDVMKTTTDVEVEKRRIISSSTAAATVIRNVDDDKIDEELEEGEVKGLVQLIDLTSDLGSVTTGTDQSAKEASVAPSVDHEASRPIPAGKKRAYSAPPSPTHSDSTVEVDMCDEDFLLG